MSKRVVVVLTHYKRERLLNNTIRSILRTKHDNYRVLIVNDDTEFDYSQMTDMVSPNFQKDNLIRVHNTNKKDGNLPGGVVVAINQGLRMALGYMNPDVIMVQNAEAYHCGDVISHAANVGENDYNTYGCFSVDKETSNHPHFDFVIEGIAKVTNVGAWGDGVLAWYNHSKYRPVAFDFCCAMTVENMVKLNGHDERYAHGIAYSDNNFVHRVQRAGLQTRIIDEPFVVHQWHEHHTGLDHPLWEHNRILHSQIMQEPGYKATHLFTPDLVIGEKF